VRQRASDAMLASRASPGACSRSTRASASSRGAVVVVPADASSRALSPLGASVRSLVGARRSTTRRLARVNRISRAAASDGGQGKASGGKTSSAGASAGSSAKAERRAGKSSAKAEKPYVKPTPIEVVDPYVSPIGEFERKIPGRKPWFRKGSATAQDARKDGLGKSERPFLTPGTKSWYDAWVAERRQNAKERFYRETKKSGRPPVEDYAKAGQAVGKPLSIEELKFTPLGRARMQLERQHIAYNRFVADLIRDEIKELYVSVDAVARYAIVYKDGRLAYCQVAPSNTEIYLLTQNMGIEIQPTMAEPASHTVSAVGDRASSVRTFIAGYGIPSLGVFAVWAIVFYMQRFRGDWEDRQKLLELERAEEAQRMAEKGDSKIALLENMLAKLDENDPQRESIKREIRNRRARIARENGDKKDAAAKAADGDQMGAANAFMKVGVKVVKAKKKAVDDEADEEEDTKAATGKGKDKGAKKGAKKGRVNTKMKLRDESEVVMFDDVAGIGTAKIELQEVVDFFLKPDKFKASGSKVPKGVLLTGPPGCGKTLLARAVAGEAGATFFSLAASEFVEMFVGVGAARVRDLFQQAKKQAPSIIFIDELDAVGRPRGGGGSGNDERDQTLNQLLVELDGFNSDTQVVCIAATNRIDVLDKALVRPGRFDRKIVIPKPDFKGRQEIMRVHAKNKPMADDIDWTKLSGETEGFSGAALANVVNLACLQAAKTSRSTVTMEDFQTALETETLGKVLPQGLGEENEKRLALIHSAAAVAYHLLCRDMVDVSFVTIVPRESNREGQVAIGENPVSLRPGVFTKGFMRRQLRSCLVPSVTEELFYGFDNCTKVTAPYSGRAREIANFFVQNAAMSDEDSEFGYVPVGHVIEVSDFLRADRKEYLMPSTTNERYIRADEETRRLMESQYEAAKRFVIKQRPAIEALQKLVLEKRTVQSEELKALIDEYAVAPFDDDVLPSAFADTRRRFAEWNGTIPSEYVTGGTKVTPTSTSTTAQLVSEPVVESVDEAYVVDNVRAVTDDFEEGDDSASEVSALPMESVDEAYTVENVEARTDDFEEGEDSA